MYLFEALHFAKDVDNLVVYMTTGCVDVCFGGPFEENESWFPIGTVSLQDVEDEFVVGVDSGEVESSFDLFCRFVSAKFEKVLDE